MTEHDSSRHASDLPGEAHGVRAAASRGARSISNRRQVVEDAIDEAVMRWEDRVLQGALIENLTAWAFRVGANAAKRIGKQSSKLSVGTSDSSRDAATLRAFVDVNPDVAAEDSPEHRAGTQELLDLIRANKRILTETQLLAGMKVCEAGMTLRRAAKELGMGPSNLRHTLMRVAQALKKNKGGRQPSPPASVLHPLDEWGNDSVGPLARSR